MDGKVITEKLLKDIGRRARNMGFRGEDAEDAVQEVAISILKFEYDPTHWKDMNEAQALSAMISRRLRDLRRKQQCYERLMTRLPKQADAADGEDSLLNVDVRTAVSALSPEEQAACLAIEETTSKEEAAQRLGCSVEDLNETLAEIRERFTAAGVTA